MKLLILAVTALVLSSNVAAQDSAATDQDTAVDIDYVDQLCDRVKQCRLGTLVAPDLAPFMQDFIVQTVNAQCVTIASNYKAKILEADLEDEAKTCVHSLENQSCDEMLASDGEASTEECNDFLLLAESSGIDFSNIEF